MLSRVGFGAIRVGLRSQREGPVDPAIEPQLAYSPIRSLTCSPEEISVIFLSMSILNTERFFIIVLFRFLADTV